MSEQFDKFMRGQAPSTKSLKDVRRVNRVLMNERIRRDAPRRRRNYRLGLVTVGLILVALFTGQVSDVGSDGWDLLKRVEDTPHLGLQTFYERPFDGFLVSGSSEEEARELLMAVESHEYTLTHFVGTEVDGRVQWIAMAMLQGKRAGDAINVMVGDPALGEYTKRHEAFDLSENFLDLIYKSKRQPPESVRMGRIAGYEVRIETWTKEYPGFGLVKRHVATLMNSED